MGGFLFVFALFFNLKLETQILAGYGCDVKKHVMLVGTKLGFSLVWGLTNLVD